jgi:selenoprotein W-related protein
MSLPAVEIEYCRQCRWLLRAAWMAQELLSTFEDEIASVTLKTGTGGIFDIRIDGATVWSRKQEGRFPDIAELKARIRDIVAPDRDLGHIDRRKSQPEDAP